MTGLKTERAKTPSLPGLLGPRQRDLGSREMQSGFFWADSDFVEQAVRPVSPPPFGFFCALGFVREGALPAPPSYPRGLRADQASGFLWQR